MGKFESLEAGVQPRKLNAKRPYIPIQPVLWVYESQHCSQAGFRSHSDVRLKSKELNGPRLKIAAESTRIHSALTTNLATSDASPRPSGGEDKIAMQRTRNAVQPASH